MKKYRHVRDKALVLRRRGKTIDEICSMLSMNRGTVYYWIKNIPIPRTDKQNEAQRRGTEAMVRKCETARKDAYNQGLQEAVAILQKKEMRDFVVMYLGEGMRKGRGIVGMGNSTPEIMKLFLNVLRRYTCQKIGYTLHIHKDHNANNVLNYWSGMMKIPKADIAVYQKNNSCQLTTRNWRAAYGTFAVRVGDTLLKSRLCAWMDVLKAEWAKM